MRTLLLAAVLIFSARAADISVVPADTFERMKTLAGEWAAVMPGFGKLSASIRLVSNGKAIEETIGIPADNEVSVYTRIGDRIVLTHYCALTPDGNVVRLETAPLAGLPENVTFAFLDAMNLHSPNAAHMRQVVMTFKDREHFSEKWTKTESGKDTIFDLEFVRQ